MVYGLWSMVYGLYYFDDLFRDELLCGDVVEQ